MGLVNSILTKGLRYVAPVGLMMYFSGFNIVESTSITGLSAIGLYLGFKAKKGMDIKYNAPGVSNTSYIAYNRLSGLSSGALIVLAVMFLGNFITANLPFFFSLLGVQGAASMLEIQGAYNKDNPDNQVKITSTVLDRVTKK